ncbi:MAG: dephospho-CoA kinase [Microbacterium sp.]
MPIIALTGGIASGKSTISRRLAEHGAVIVDADALVHELQAPGQPVLARMAEEFGPQILREDGSLDRAALGGIVFADKDALARLNSIVHPAVKEESQRRFRAAIEADPTALVVYDLPLLVEARSGDAWDAIVVADAPAAIRRQRLIDERGMTPAEADARLANQVSDAERRAIADIMIDTSGSLAYTLDQADALWRRFETP